MPFFCGGLHSGGSGVSAECWKYDHVQDYWTLATVMAEKRRNYGLAKISHDTIWITGTVGQELEKRRNILF